MTIRDRLQAQLFKARVAAVAFWLLGLTGFFLPRGGAYEGLMVLPVLGFAGSILYVAFGIRCPNCNTRLGLAMSTLRKPNFCPTCGVDFDTDRAP